VRIDSLGKIRVLHYAIVPPMLPFLLGEKQGRAGEVKNTTFSTY